MYYTVIVRDRDGKVISRERRKSRSYVRQWNDLMSVMMCPSTDKTIKDTGGIDRTIHENSQNFDAEVAAADARYGIVVGRGSTAVTISDYALETLCGEGTGTNQVNYQGTICTAPTVAGSSCSFTIRRTAENHSGATIMVTEIGINVFGEDTALNSRFFLGVRDVLSALSVPDGGSITVTYTLKVTV